jgi:hypothetical protein
MRFSSIATGVALLGLLFGLAGCGGSLVSTTTSSDGGELAYLEELTKLNEEFEATPASKRLDASLQGNGPRMLPEFEEAVEAYLPVSAEYSAKVEKLDFPACARSLQRQRLHLEADAREVFEGALPVVRGGDLNRLAAYMGQAMEPVEAEQADFNRNVDRILGAEGC